MSRQVRDFDASLAKVAGTATFYAMAVNDLGRTVATVWETLQR